MKTFVAFIAVSIIVSTFVDSAMGLAKYLDELPNGSSFSQELGHPDNDSSQYTDFATTFADADFCAQMFPGSTMTNGAAFGDPCCTWKKDGTPDFTMTAFITTPDETTVCNSGGSSASAAASTGSAETDSRSCHGISCSFGLRIRGL